MLSGIQKILLRVTFQDNVPKMRIRLNEKALDVAMTHRIKLSSCFTHLFNKSRQAAEYNGVKHTSKNAHPEPVAE